MRRALVAVAALSALISGCGGIEQEPNLAEAVERTEATGSSRIEIHAEVRCEGTADYSRKRFRLTCDSGEIFDVVVVIESSMYVRAERSVGFGIDTRWAKLPVEADDPLRDFSPENLLDILRAASQGTDRVGEEDVRSEPTVRYRLLVDCEEAALGCVGETTLVPVDVWIGGDGLVRRIWVDGADAGVTIEFFDFGIEVDIEAPPGDQVVEIDEPCEPGEPKPVRADQAVKALRRHGFSVTKEEQACFGDVAAVLTNATRGDAAAVLDREGVIDCFVYVNPRDGAPKSVVRRGVDGGDAELLLENLTCTILADSPQAEEKIDPLEEAFDELQRAIRP